ncbi:glycosyl hydrolase family 8 [Mucilaginibacter sp. L3T2-6]|uniref:glycosyl hydrolase family 8 n=1 Tax=Mucilaginibacter sp. L3T2-6 TaxID=3062491 RepID=UPI00267683B6|nr:glycosyl hydrolase family 8 [Mucilaginibacter sp. L3T2-6]MDO3644223.1 glycosyl hydrolase family 8 [Mucilaginibacter sp. L3T2-6]MDV6216680.1 glycosyl hydrolase family 8 [Mucilaginibacter sp. L3T2-6]
MKKLLVIIFFYTNSLFAQAILKPFPQHVKYFPGAIKPNHVTQIRLDDAVKTFYNQWKTRFIKQVPGTNEDFIWFENKGRKQCVSEGQGYGMIIMALMAGFDASAKDIYDNLFRYARAHPSGKSKYLMAWAQYANNKSTDNTSASDGDLDIAYSLLLADKQWGSKGKINYQAEAKATINAIMQHEINHQTWTVLLSDGIERESRDYFTTRSSDFMPAHFKAFRRATDDARWDKVINTGYKLFITMQDKYSPDAGLIPDFIVNINKKPKPAQPNFLESPYDGQYNYNACRVPWRITADYLMTGDERSKHIAGKINRWVMETTNNDTYNLSAGYTLAGNDIKHRYFEALSFIAPFGVSATIEGKNQAWLNKLWNYLNGFKLKDYDYYDNTIKLLDMIIISGNYWRVK